MKILIITLALTLVLATSAFANCWIPIRPMSNDPISMLQYNAQMRSYHECLQRQQQRNWDDLNRNLRNLQDRNNRNDWRW